MSGLATTNQIQTHLLKRQFGHGPMGVPPMGPPGMGMVTPAGTGQPAFGPHSPENPSHNPITNPNFNPAVHERAGAYNQASSTSISSLAIVVLLSATFLVTQF